MELVVIILIIIIVFGAKTLPRIGETIGRTIVKARKRSEHQPDLPPSDGKTPPGA